MFMLLPQGLFTDTQQNGKDLPRRHGGRERKRECCGYLSCGVPHLKFPQPFLESFNEKEEIFQHTTPLFPLWSPSKKGGVYFGHGIPVDEINATLYFLSLPPCLRGKSLSSFSFEALENPYGGHLCAPGGVRRPGERCSRICLKQSPGRRLPPLVRTIRSHRHACAVQYLQCPGSSCCPRKAFRKIAAALNSLLPFNRCPPQYRLNRRR